MDSETLEQFMDRMVPVGSDGQYQYQPTDEEWMRWEAGAWAALAMHGFGYNDRGFMRVDSTPSNRSGEDHEGMLDREVHWTPPGLWVVSGYDVLPVVGWTGALAEDGSDDVYLPVTQRGVFVPPGGREVLTYDAAVAEAASRREFDAGLRNEERENIRLAWSAAETRPK